ncbi:hypothetical protein C8F01DRAFT_1376050 [Mycena amicta]|nr:hypothetical protein C8F01DRAFT_1376050 [Mycena amicta]
MPSSPYGLPMVPSHCSAGIARALCPRRLHEDGADAHPERLFERLSRVQRLQGETNPMRASPSLQQRLASATLSSYTRYERNAQWDARKHDEPIEGEQMRMVATTSIPSPALHARTTSTLPDGNRDT